MVNVTYWIYIAVEDEKIHDMLSCGMGKIYKEKQTRTEAGGDKIKFTIQVFLFYITERKSQENTWRGCIILPNRSWIHRTLETGRKRWCFGVELYLRQNTCFSHWIVCCDWVGGHKVRHFLHRFALFAGISPPFLRRQVLLEKVQSLPNRIDWSWWWRSRHIWRPVQE